MGGHCLPVDPFYLSWRAREFDMATEFIELAGKVNQQMPYHCVAKAQRALNDSGLSVKGARVAVVGVSYKPGVGDVRESPALKIISLLGDLGAEVLYHASTRLWRSRPARSRERATPNIATRSSWRS
jgi:UDP-N-acetyl-D-glucosamine dehydrogenase